MRTGLLFFGNIASSLHLACFNQMWKYYYKVPVINAPCYSNSKISDIQCGYEKTIGALNAALSGANIILMHGAIYGELTYSPIQSIIDDDIANMIGKLIESIDVNKETLAVDLIHKVGSSPSSYLAEEHTSKWWKDNQFIPKAADSLSPTKWLESGKKTALDYAKDRMHKLLENYKKRPLLDDQKERGNLIRQKAIKYYKQKGLL